MKKKLQPASTKAMAVAAATTVTGTTTSGVRTTRKTAMTTGTDGKLPGHEQYEKVRKLLQGGNRAQIDKALEQLVKTCQGTAVEKVKIDDDQLGFWLNDILRLLFDWENALTRDLALKASEAICPHLAETGYPDCAAWPSLRSQISSTYSNLLEQARGRNDPEWHRKWSVMVQILDKEICQGAAIINAYLAIVESGFRSAELLVREQSFDCWKLLTFIFAKYNQINSPKRVKLICIPLKSSKSKTETIARRKFEIWWFMVNQLGAELEKFAEAVFEPFIYFCFGPSFKTPLCYYFDDSYQEFGTPGKFYDPIKQLSAIALIHMLGPADKITDALLKGNGCTDSFALPIPFTPIPASLVSEKMKLLFNSCIECTVLLSQMKDKPYLELNRNLWRNLLARVESEKGISRPEMLAWMQENLAALVKLSALRRDDAMREVAFDTVRMVSETNLMAVTIGQDSPEQLTSNYRLMMPLLFNSELDFPEEISRSILSHWFDLKRYTATTTPRGYWDMLQKTVQYLSDLEPSLLADPKANTHRRMITQIYCSMAPLLREQINKCPRGGDQFEQNFLPIALGFLLYPLEYDRFVHVENLREEWQAVYGAVVAAGQKGSTRFACAFSEMIKAMTVAKYNANLGVILEFFRVVLESVPGDFDMAHPPVKTLELFKDLVRKGLVFQNSLIEVAKGVATFRRLLERMSNKGLLVVIMPVRNVISELVSGESETLAEEIRGTLKLLADRFATAKFVTDLRSQPKEVKWNCKMLVGVLLELPAAMHKQWKIAELRKLIDICEGKDTPAKTTKPSKKDEFVVIDKVWKFTPDKLTEHQRERMREKRDDIPALYNDMSQSQDSFVIKPWTPNKAVLPAQNDAVEAPTMNGGEAPQQEASVPKEEGSTGVQEKIDKENNNGNVPNGKEDAKEAESSGTNGKKVTSSDKRARVARELDRLKINAVDGQNIHSGRLARTRRSESLEPSGPPTRRKAVEPKKVTQSAKADVKNRRSTRKSDKILKQESAPELTAAPIQEVSPKKERPKSPVPERTSPRKSLNFDNVVVDREPAAATEAPSTSSPVKAKAINESIDEVIESSQASPGAAPPPQLKKYTPRKPKDEDVVMASETSELDTLASPSKNTRSSTQKWAEMDTEPNTEIPETQSEVVEETSAIVKISTLKAAKSPKKEPEISPARATRSPRKEPLEEIKKSTSPARAAKSPKKEQRSLSPPAPMEVVPESPEKPKEEAALVSPNLSPIRDNLDEKMEPLAKALNRSLVSSPDGEGQDEREADLLNSTLNISPIPEEKHQPSTPSVSTAPSQPTSGSGEKRASSRLMDREKSAMPSPTVTRRTRNSPPVIPAAVANLKARAATTPQMTPRSPSTNRIELRGRGAQLINLIRNQQHEGSPKPSTPVPNTSTPKQGPSTPSDRSLMLRKLATSAAANQSPEQPKPLEKEKEKDYLVFSKVLPSPQASPAASILKRKYNHDDSGDDESPANKRKRVSFHDPPVSITKEYIRQEEELGRSPSIIRCLQMSSGAGGMSPSDKAKFLLRRKSKADSIVELAKFTKVETDPVPTTAAKDDEEEIGSSPESLDEDFAINTTDQMEALQVTTDVPEDVEMKEDVPEPAPPRPPTPPVELPKRTSPRKISPKTEPPSPKKPASPTPAPEKPDTSIRFPTEEDVLTHVISTYSLDQILERYLSTGKTLEQNKTARLLTRELSTLMAKDAKTKHIVLDELSERHSAEFLDHAVQENSAKAVCARLSLATMTEFVFESLRKLPAHQEEERTRVLQTIFDQLTQMDQQSNTAEEFRQMRDRFVQRVVQGKSKLGVMELLEEYFWSSREKTEEAGSGST